MTTSSQTTCGLVLAFLLLALCPPATAGRPFSTEDAGVIGKGACEVESFAERLHAAGSARESGLSVQLGCGVVGGTQLAFALAEARAAGERSRAMLFSGKTQLIDGGEDRPSLALAYFTTRDRAPGASWRAGASGVNAAVTAPLAGWLLHANLGVTAERSPSRNVTGWALALERPAALNGVDAGVELFGDDRDTTWAQVAARWHFAPERLLFDVSAGRQTAGGRSDRFTLGMKWIF